MCRALAVARADAGRVAGDGGVKASLVEQWERVCAELGVDDAGRLLEELAAAGLVRVVVVSVPRAIGLNPLCDEVRVYDGLTLDGARLGLGV